MSESSSERRSDRRRWGRPSRNYGCGCGGFLLVLTIGILFSLFNFVFGIGVSLRVPFTDSNATLAASLGAKAKAAGALPNYTHGRLGGNQNLVNSTQMLTLGPAEGAILFVLGRQPGAPVVDLHIAAR